MDIENCISDIHAWMLIDRLKINDDKTELLVILLVQVNIYQKYQICQ